MTLSNLDLINQCDSFPNPATNPDLYTRTLSTLFEFRIQGHDYALGYLLPSVALVFQDVPNWSLDTDSRILTLTSGHDVRTRTAAIAETLLALRKTQHFAVLAKWRNEAYGIWGRNKELLVTMERAACALFGVVTYGVHLNAYVRDPETGEIKIWTPRRARNKHTYPGMLDNCVAGGLEASEAPLECLVRECAEEASLPEALIRERARPVGTVTYFHVRTGMAGGETGLLQPECQYVYDVELPADVVPQPGDDEVEEFYLWSVDEVRAAMARGEFKPNCAVVVLDWLVRWGFLSEESERDYAEVVSRCHRLLEFPMR